MNVMALPLLQRIILSLSQNAILIMTRSGKFVVNVTKNVNDVPNSSSTHPEETFYKALQRSEYVLLLLNRLLIGFVTIYMAWMCLRLKGDDIPWHALLCTVGFVCLMSEGLLAHYRGNAWTHLCYRVEKTRTHWILQLLGSSLGIGGIAVKFGLEEQHFQSTHGQLGLACFVLCLFSLFSGLGSLYAASLKNCIQPLFNKAVHNVIGLCAYSTAMWCMFYAFDTDIFIELSLDASNFRDFRWLVKSLMLLIWALSSYGPLWCLIYSKLWRCR